MAETWAAGCDWRHGQPRPADNQMPAPFNAIGQNLYLTTARTMDLTAGTDAWYNEKADYDYETQKCADGRVCGHYTQVTPTTRLKRFLAICRPSGCTVVSGVVVVVGVCNRSQTRTSKSFHTRLIFGVSIGLDPG